MKEQVIEYDAQLIIPLIISSDDSYYCRCFYSSYGYCYYDDAPDGSPTKPL